MRPILPPPGTVLDTPLEKGSDTQVEITRDLLYGVLYVDAKERKKKQWPLFNVEHLNANEKHFGKINDDVFRVISPGTDVSRRYSLASNSSVCEMFNRSFPFTIPLLRQFKGSLIVAGGSIARSLYQSSRVSDGDVDFFFVRNPLDFLHFNIDEQQYVNDLMERVISFCYDYAGQARVKIRVFRNTKTVTIVVTSNYTVSSSHGDKFEQENSDYVRSYNEFETDYFEQKYQFVVGRLYSSPSEVIAGFDIGASQSYFDGEKVYFTSLGIFTFLTGILIVDPTRRSLNYEGRLRKYAKMGFTIAMSFLSKRTMIGYLAARSISGQDMTFEPIKGLRVRYYEFNFYCHSVSGDELVSDYGVGLRSTYCLEVANSLMLLKGKYGDLNWETGTTEAIPIPKFNFPRKIIKSEEPFDLIKMSRWVTKEQAVAFYSECPMESTGECLGTIAIGLPKISTVQEKWMSTVKKEIISTVFKLVPKALEFLNDKSNWVFYGTSDNPGRQHTSSFNPIPADIDNYYHHLAIKKVIGVSHEMFFVLKFVWRHYHIDKNIWMRIYNMIVEPEATCLNFIGASVVPQLEENVWNADSTRLTVNRLISKMRAKKAAQIIYQ